MKLTKNLIALSMILLAPSLSQAAGVDFALVNKSLAKIAQDLRTQNPNFTSLQLVVDPSATSLDKGQAKISYAAAIKDLAWERGATGTASGSFDLNPAAAKPGQSAYTASFKLSAQTKILPMLRFVSAQLQKTMCTAQAPSTLCPYLQILSQATDFHKVYVAAQDARAKNPQLKDVDVQETKDAKGAVTGLLIKYSYKNDSDDGIVRGGSTTVNVTNAVVNMVANTNVAIPNESADGFKEQIQTMLTGLADGSKVADVSKLIGDYLMQARPYMFVP
jgi:hypothetical protein